MSDLVKRLRKLAYDNYEMLNNIHEPLNEAANEIERLEEAAPEIDTQELIDEIERLRDAFEMIIRNDPEGYEASIARKVLEGKAVLEAQRELWRKLPFSDF